MKKIEVAVIAVLAAISAAMLYVVVPAEASVTDSPTDAQYNPPNIPSEPTAPPTDTIGILPFTGLDIFALALAAVVITVAGLLIRHGAIKRHRRDDDEALRELEEAGWSPRMDWNWPVRKSGLVETDRDD